MSDFFENLLRVPIDVIIQYGENYPCDIYIRLSDDNAVKLAQKNDKNKQIFQKYKKKGVRYVYVDKEIFPLFLYAAKNKLAFHLASTESFSFQVIEDLEFSFELLREGFRGCGVSEELIEFAETICQESLQVLNSVPDIFKQFEKFRQNADDDFLKYLFHNYLLSFMLAPKGKTINGLLGKLSMISLLHDMNLTKEEIKELQSNQGNPQELSPKVHKHPHVLAKWLSKFPQKFTPESITIMEQHHERPGGMGFPIGLSSNKVLPLSAHFIVGLDFTDCYFASQCDERAISMILNSLAESYTEGPYKKAVDALYRVFYPASSS